MVVEVKGLDEVIGKFGKFVKINSTATRIAINDTARKARTRSLRRAKKDWTLKYGQFKDSTTLKPATNGNLEAIFSMKAQSMPLQWFKADYVGSKTPKGYKRKGGAGVKYKLSTKTRGKNTLSNAFVMKSKYNSGRLEVFTRRPSPVGNADITAQYAITPTSMFKQEGAEDFAKEFKEHFETRYLQQVGFRTL